MATVYPCKSAGSGILPITDGSYDTDVMSYAHTEAQAYIEFFSDAAATVPATPTGGTVSFSGSPLGNVFLAPGENATFNAATVSAPNATYTPAEFLGPMVKGRVTFAGITGVLTAKVSFWRN